MYHGEKIYSWSHKIIKTDAGAHNLRESVFRTQNAGIRSAPGRIPRDAARFENALAEPFKCVHHSSLERMRDSEFVTVTARPTYEKQHSPADALPRGGT